METSERLGLAAISKWRRDSLLPWAERWEQCYWPGWYVRGDRLREVCWASSHQQTNQLELIFRAEKYATDDDWSCVIPCQSVRQAILVLAVMGFIPWHILPTDFLRGDEGNKFVQFLRDSEPEF